MVAFNKHPSPQLVSAFKGYQGQNPSDARYLFMGLDANFSSTIDQDPIFQEVLEYLSDGVGYWKTKHRHHPFLSRSYEKGSGYRYHRQFSKMGLTPEYADKISFVELLGCPTCGNTNHKRFIELLDVDYLRKLDFLISSSKREKVVFIARGAYVELFKIGKKFDCFSWLPEPKKFRQNQLYSMPISNNLQLHVITHFSDSISDKHIAEIKEVIEAPSANGAG